jgi:hypothetical protein
VWFHPVEEFRQQGRSGDCRKEDPIDPVYRLIREIKSGHFKDKTGREIKVQSDRILAYAYVICDTTKEVEIIAQNKGLLPTPDQLGYYGYNPSLSAYVEIISYTKLLRDAKKAKPNSVRQTAPSARDKLTVVRDRCFSRNHSESINRVLPGAIPVNSGVRGNWSSCPAGSG